MESVTSRRAITIEFDSVRSGMALIDHPVATRSVGTGVAGPFIHSINDFSHDRRRRVKSSDTASEPVTPLGLARLTR